MTTRAMAQGFIEGTLEDYRMAAAFATDFLFSRFDALVAAARNVSELGEARWAAGTSIRSPPRPRGGGACERRRLLYRVAVLGR